MPNTEIEKTVITVTVSELEKIKNSRGEKKFMIIPSDYENCIYRVLDIDLTEERTSQQYLSVCESYKYNRSFFGSSNRKLELNFIWNNNIEYYKNIDGLIHLVLSEEEKTKIRITERDSYHYIQIDDILEFRINAGRYGAKASIDINGSVVKLKINGQLFEPTIVSRYSRGKDCFSVVDYIINSNLKTHDINEISTLCSYIFGEKPLEIGKAEGCMKTINRLSEFYKNEKQYISKVIFNYLAQSGKRTIDSVKFSTIFNKLFENIESQETFSTKCESLCQILFDKKDEFLEQIMNIVDEAKELKKAALKRKSTGAFNKIMEDLDFVKIDETKYPLTHQAVHSGDIPLGTFFRKNGDSYFVYNDNWELWEIMLKDYRDIAIEIAKACSSRTTYEKDIMSYFYFTFIELPEYLHQQTGKIWKGIPKLVDSENELDPPKEGETGTSKSRSALTPIVDNELSTVTVPYVSMRMSGYQTTYCYGLTYSVLKRGFSMSGNTVMKDVEKELNGRDDYGLMFYTLTGSSQGRGYPTFLIIFERLLKTTRVHFHRTHPMRSKGGDYNPVHNWTQGCYKWMVGNVNFERIKAQQGDLAFVQIDKFPEGESEKVNGYDSHMFEEPVDYLPYTKSARQNILGYVNINKPTALNHTEHMTRIIPAGYYEIRQCRSWEANPKGIWSLRID